MAARAQTGIDALPPALAGSDAWSAYRQQLIDEALGLRVRIAAHNASCAAVPSDNPGLIAQCSQERAALAAQSAAYTRDLATYRLRLAAPFAPGEGTAGKPLTRNGRVYQRSGNGMIGGTVWITGFNVQSADPALVARAHAMMAEQMRLAGMPYADAVDFEHYNFVLGIASATDAAGPMLGKLLDLGTRVIRDEYTNGAFSADNQALYASLRGRAFGDLACHSNGAMVCLAALSRGDVVAERVTLFGPQMTVDALRAWDRLVREGTVRSLRLVYNASDPVMPLSLAIGGGVGRAGAPLIGLALLKPAVLERLVHEEAPTIAMRTLGCGRGVDLDCHGMDAYRRGLARAGCRPVSSGLRVPGTALPGRPDTAYLEPPPPC